MLNKCVGCTNTAIFWTTLLGTPIPFLLRKPVILRLGRRETVVRSQFTKHECHGKSWVAWEGDYRSRKTCHSVVYANSRRVRAVHGQGLKQQQSHTEKWRDTGHMAFIVRVTQTRESGTVWWTRPNCMQAECWPICLGLQIFQRNMQTLKRVQKLILISPELFSTLCKLHEHLTARLRTGGPQTSKDYWLLWPCPRKSQQCPMQGAECHLLGVFALGR